MEITINSPVEMISLGEKIGRLLRANDIITLTGDLGAGKTTLTKGIARGLDIDAVVNSPTFTILKIYDGRLRLYHLDVYRIENLNDDFELEEYFDDGGVCVIEWASNIEGILPENVLNITINDIGNNRRIVNISDKTNQYHHILAEVEKC